MTEEEEDSPADFEDFDADCRLVSVGPAKLRVYRMSEELAGRRRDADTSENIAPSTIVPPRLLEWPDEDDGGAVADPNVGENEENYFPPEPEYVVVRLEDLPTQNSSSLHRQIVVVEGDSENLIEVVGGADLEGGGVDEDVRPERVFIETEEGQQSLVGLADGGAQHQEQHQQQQFVLVVDGENQCLDGSSMKFQEGFVQDSTPSPDALQESEPFVILQGSEDHDSAFHPFVRVLYSESSEPESSPSMTPSPASWNVPSTQSPSQSQSSSSELPPYPGSHIRVPTSGSSHPGPLIRVRKRRCYPSEMTMTPTTTTTTTTTRATKTYKKSAKIKPEMEDSSLPPPDPPWHEDVQCTLCKSYTFDLQQHLKLHCDVCNLLLKDRSSLEAHKRARHAALTGTCSCGICGEKFVSSECLRTHLQLNGYHRDKRTQEHIENEKRRYNAAVEKKRKKWEMERERRETERTIKREGEEIGGGE